MCATPNQARSSSPIPSIVSSPSTAPLARMSAMMKYSNGLDAVIRSARACMVRPSPDRGPVPRLCRCSASPRRREPDPGVGAAAAHSTNRPRPSRQPPQPGRIPSPPARPRVEPTGHPGGAGGPRARTAPTNVEHRRATDYGVVVARDGRARYVEADAADPSTRDGRPRPREAYPRAASARAGPPRRRGRSSPGRERARPVWSSSLPAPARDRRSRSSHP